MILPMPLEDLMNRVGPTGERLLYGEEMTEADRVVGSFACALILWLVHNEPAHLVEIANKLSDEMEASDKLQ